MICRYCLAISLSILISAGAVHAQNNTEARALVKEGNKLSDEKKYLEAVEKYKAALTIDSAYLFADYQAASALYSLNRGNEAIPYLRKVISTQTSITAAGYELLGLIYFSDKKYSEAERCAVETIRLDPKNAGAARMYALVTFHQNKRAAALLGFCNFLLLEPHTARGAEAYGNIQHILHGGILKPEPAVEISHGLDAYTNELNMAITRSVAEAGKAKYNSPADLLAAQLRAIFIAVGQQTEKQKGDEFFRQYLAGYFYRLAQSPNMPAFARLVSASTPESAKWLKENPKQMADLEVWLKSTGRIF